MIFTARSTKGPFTGVNFITPVVHAFFSNEEGLWIEVSQESEPFNFGGESNNGLAVAISCRTNSGTIPKNPDLPFTTGIQYREDGSLCTLEEVFKRIEP